MNDYRPEHIPADRIAFDIDGVVADTMSVFIRLAHERFGLTRLTRDHISCYDLRQCLGMEPEVLRELICLTLDDEHTLQAPPMPGAPEVLTRLAAWGPLRFVTARIWPESITQWLHDTLPEVPAGYIQVIATGAPEAKLAILAEMGIQYFVEDRIETCRHLAQNGLRPLLFDQPWNRAQGSDGEFPRIRSWEQLRQWVLPLSGDFR